jgi:hypothetical protein
MLRLPACQGDGGDGWFRRLKLAGGWSSALATHRQRVEPSWRMARKRRPFESPRNDEGEMTGIKFSDEVRRQWLADKEAKRDAALKALAAETDPKLQRKLQARARRYKAMINMGPEGTSAASSNARRTQGYPSKR